jgi:hypothetical protein
MDHVIPLPSDFSHDSCVHGQAHVARVMVHAFRLLDATGLVAETSRVWAAVFIHDLARRHDDVCPRHGADAVRRLRLWPALQAYLVAGGTKPGDWPAIERAVTIHCLPSTHEPARDHEDWPLVALLKDADALDRVRLGDLDPSYLRLPASKTMIPFAEALYQETDGRLPEGIGHFERLLAVAEPLAGVPVHVPAVIARIRRDAIELR